MEAGDTGVTDLLDTVHYEMDSMVHNDHGYKSARSSMIGEPVLEKELVGQST